MDINFIRTVTCNEAEHEGGRDFGHWGESRVLTHPDNFGRGVIKVYVPSHHFINKTLTGVDIGLKRIDHPSFLSIFPASSFFKKYQKKRSNSTFSTQPYQSAASRNMAGILLL